MSDHEQTSMTDAEVVAAVLAGDRDAYSLLIDRHQRRIFVILLRLCRSASDAEELAQEVMVRTYFALSDYNADYKFSSWISRIACNLGVDHLRRKGWTTSIDDEETGPQTRARLRDPDQASNPVSSFKSNEQSRALWGAVATLPPDFRDIVLMRHAEELSYREISSATGLSMGTVKSRLARARKRLAEALGEAI